MAEFTKKVFKIGQSSKPNKNGNHWTVIDVEGKEAGTIKQENIFDAEIKAMFSKGPGVYKISYTKNDKYWNITNAEYIGALPGGAVPASNGNGHAAAPVAAVTRTMSTLEAKTAIAVAALSATGVIIAAGKEPTAAADVMDHAALLARMLMSEARNFVAGGTSAPTKAEVLDQDPVGA